MGILESLGSSMGLGQPEIKGLFDDVIDRVEKRNSAVTPDFRKGSQAVLAAILEELQSKDLVSKATFQSITSKIKNCFGPSR